MKNEASRAGPLALFALLSYVAVLANTAAYFRETTIDGAIPLLFLVAVWLTYSAIYTAAALSPVGVLGLVLRVLRVRAPFLLLGLAVLLTAGLQCLLYADREVFRLYGFHVNGFVVNMVTTPGGIESLGAGRATMVSAALIGAGFFGLQAGIAFVACRLSSRSGRVVRMFRRSRMVIALVLLASLSLLERVTYGLSSLKAYAPVLANANTFPFYLPFTFRKLAKAVGIEAADRDTFRMRSGSIRLEYPREPLRIKPGAERYNIVWLVAESLRADMLTPEIMPATHRFAQRHAVFANHVSGGNGTRMGVFSMFYGLFGPYWFPFLAERRGPVLVDVLRDADYRFALYTSARFTYPEFDSTVWAAVPSKDLYEDYGDLRTGWKRDRRNVDRMLMFLKQRDPQTPFFTFLFFESPHAPYHFPDDSVIATPFLSELNYATMDLEKDIQLMRNRYVNACHHLDSQVGRILDRLERDGLLDRTIVVITGDHGEEFMEHGRWGHNSNFVREQIHVPLVVGVPHRAPERVDALTSHVDLPATVLKLLGVENPPGDYCLGRDLFGPRPRRYAVVSTWNDLVYVDEESFAVFPLKGLGLRQTRICRRDGIPVKDRSAFLRSRRPRLVEILRALKRFSR